MKGISEKKLREWKRKARQHGLDGIKSDELLNLIIEDCEELNAWKPIETIPHDIRVLLFYTKYGVHAGTFKSEYQQYWANDLCVPIKEQPTHWQELQPPKEQS